MGRLIPDFFPAIFGPDENLPLDAQVVAEKFERLTAEINQDTGKSMTAYQVADGFLDVANESMGRPIKALTEARGYETRQHTLASFGGAGSQAAIFLADKLGIRRIVIHKYSSILSAYGMALAEIVQEAQEPSSEVLEQDSIPRLQERLQYLKAKVTAGLVSQGVTPEAIAHESYLNLRYHGTDTNFMIREPADQDWRTVLEIEHMRELSFTFPRSRKVVIDDVRVRGVGQSSEVSRDNARLVDELKGLTFSSKVSGEDRVVNTYFADGGLQPTRVYILSQIAPGSLVHGPCIIIDATQTIVVAPGAQAKILTSHVVIDLAESEGKKNDASEQQELDPIKLSIFGHRFVYGVLGARVDLATNCTRFMSIAEQMGRTLQKTSLSLNIKERLDFSCAIFSPDGELVGKPSLPAHARLRELTKALD